MKISKKFAELKKKLIDKGLGGKAVLVSRCGLDGEMIEFDLEAVDEKVLSYFSTMIIKKNGVE